VRDEILQVFQLNAYDLGRRVGMLAAAVTAANAEMAIQSGWWTIGVGLAQPNLVTEEEILPPVESMTPADDRPVIGCVERHAVFCSTSC
jgi:hypothetical protein